MISQIHKYQFLMVISPLNQELLFYIPQQILDKAKEEYTSYLLLQIFLGQSYHIQVNI